MRAKALCAAIAMGLAAPSMATTYVLAYQGGVEFSVPKATYIVDHEIGFGTFELNDSLSGVSLGSGLLDFKFTTVLSESVQYGFAQTPVTSTITRVYNLTDLQAFSATVSGNTITSLNFKAGPFLGLTGAGIDSSRGGGRPDILGTLTAGVPEPGTWAMMLIGFGAVGLGMRRRRSVPAQA